MKRRQLLPLLLLSTGLVAADCDDREERRIPGPDSPVVMTRHGAVLRYYDREMSTVCYVWMPKGYGNLNAPMHCVPGVEVQP